MHISSNAISKKRKTPEPHQRMILRSASKNRGLCLSCKENSCDSVCFDCRQSSFCANCVKDTPKSCRFCNCKSFQLQSCQEKTLLASSIQTADSFANCAGGKIMFITLGTSFQLISGAVVSDVRMMISQIKEVYKSLPALSLMSVDECEILLMQLHNIIFDKELAFGLQNILVALCRHSWAVDVSLGGSGVCYYGSMGWHPKGISEVVQILETNDSLIRGDRDFICW